jgi:MFS family permease
MREGVEDRPQPEPAAAAPAAGRGRVPAPFDAEDSTMASQAAAPASAHAQYNPTRLFIISCMSLATGALVFSLFANIMPALGKAFTLNDAELGGIAGSWGIGLAIAVFTGSAVLDSTGMKRAIGLACILQVIGVLVTVFTPALSGLGTPITVLLIGQIFLGLGHGLIEATINPLAATVYPGDKTHRLNVLHAWWPGGLVIGGLLGFGLGRANVDWRIQYGVILLPALAYGAMVLGQEFPPTERKAAGVPTGEMVKQVLKPLYIVWWCCMWLTAAMELAPGRWVNTMLSNVVHLQGILLLVYISALMFVMRHFAGPLAHRLSPVGLMWISALLAGIGLYALSLANNPGMAFLAATIWGVGVCYMWPTMLGVTSERFPKGGALLMGLTGTAGMLSNFAATWVMGWISDRYTQAFLGAIPLSDAIADPTMKSTLQQARDQAAPYAFQWIAACALVLVVVFGAIWLRDRAMGGYKVERLGGEEVEMGQADPGDFSVDAAMQAEAAGPDTHPAVDLPTVVAESFGSGEATQAAEPKSPTDEGRTG